MEHEVRVIMSNGYRLRKLCVKKYPGVQWKGDPNDPKKEYFYIEGNGERVHLGWMHSDGYVFHLYNEERLEFVKKLIIESGANMNIMLD